MVRDLDKALTDIVDIRSQLAAGTMFRGFGPIVIFTTGVLAVLTASLQQIWPDVLAKDAETLLAVWICTALVCGFLVGGEMIARTRRLHGGLGDAMLINAVENFLPAGTAGAVVGAVIYQFAPSVLWILPGLWQILVALGIFAAARTLPRAIALVGAWYFLAGVTVLILCAGTQSITPWVMGVPFAVGQGIMAVILKRAVDPPKDCNFDQHDRDG